MNLLSREHHLVKVRDLSFSYEGDLPALREVSFGLKPGQLLAVLGANGAGKSTLCYLLSGIIPNIFSGRRRGEIQVGGLDPWHHKVFEMAHITAVSLQDPEAQLFLPDLFMEISFGPANLGIPRQEIIERVRTNLETVGLGGMETRSTRALSGGQKQRAVLAGALAMAPQVLILDEPTSQLDPLGSTQILDSISRIKREGKLAIIMTTHKTDEILQLADMVLVLAEGQVVAQGLRGGVLSRAELLERAGIQPPPAQKLFFLLQQAGFQPWRKPLDTQDIVEVLREGVKEKTLYPSPPPDRKTLRSGPSPPLLSVQELTVEYPGPPPVSALKEVSLEISRGEFVGIIGQNGSGKSTLVKALVGLVRPKRGHILLEGQDVSALSVGQLSWRVGMVMQNPDYQLFSNSALEEVLFGLTNLRVPPERARQLAQGALEVVGLQAQSEIFPFRMSFGDRRRLAVAAVLAMGPEILILDEPTTAQDHRGRYLLSDLARELRDQHGRTVVMITHDMELIASYADRLIVLSQGRVLLDGPPRQVFSETDLLARAFLRPPWGMTLSHWVLPQGHTPYLTVEEMGQCLIPRGGRSPGADSL